jgi:glutathione synthase/RimK-type ligase-like ATP-grasp enzyme
MNTFDLAIAYDWEFDVEFISAIEKTMQQLGFSTYVITDKNIFEVTESVKQRRLSFRCLLDRASDVNDNFIELNRILTKKRAYVFNPHKIVEHAIDKANMHLEFITSGINVPYSIIIPPHSQAKEIFISIDDLELLGRPFIIKPCNTTGGGMGVVKGAESLKEVLNARQKHSNDKYLIQEKIYPKMLDGKRAWFRCYWAFGKTICVWWDDETHIYNQLHDFEVEEFGLKKLFLITKTIHRLTLLDFFSTEIALTTKNRFVVIDYVNDQCDMRLKTLHADGVPDNVVSEIINNLRLFVAKVKRKNQ